ncbi:HAMP domain-containing sensor histidine kinase [Clostridium paridis]|uniref:histidine kinase n=1 Tax=Clostridium paridis TaxID=2803863 RepID=A0A937FD05_9CLOT|nr:HAMP domain-containing sensor histidine kinase [Clostridium paridis]MBL4931790.1 HAMP domain-containing histidine kinase [Clostridium paridis]
MKLRISLKLKLLIETVLSFILTLMYLYVLTIYVFAPYITKNQYILETYRVYYILGIYLVTAIGTFILFFLLLSNRHIKYIRYMAKEIKAIASGNLGQQLEVKGKDELAELCVNINFMSKELKDKFEYERELEKNKAELITNISHDLRTPLTPIIAYLDILKSEKFTTKEELNEYLNSSFNLSIKLKTLIDELFEYTKLSNREINLELVKVNICPIINQIIGEYSPMLENKGLKVIPRSFDEEIFVNIDIEKIVRVFENILSNAEKYSFKPSDILINLEKDKDNIIVSISNKGEHLNQDELNKIFEKFYRVDVSRSNKIQGSGLGLAISKKIVELHGGEMWAECKRDIITVFIKLLTI